MENTENKRESITKAAELAAALSKAKLMSGLIGTAEIRIDEEHVSVPLHRFEELVRSETELKILLRAYQQQSHYLLEYTLQAVFGMRNPDEPKKDDGNA